MEHYLSDVTPEQYYYGRNHFPYPAISEQSFKLSVGGEILRPLVFSYQDLLRLPSKEIMVVLECSGNNRRHFAPKVFGEQWEGGAMSQGVWKTGNRSPTSKGIRFG
ncbi:molybdopterin-dependent oxidoreductase [Paenibacillus sp. CC-CFT747]|nr:molybdopterin-dependent oxidoreductase [Paenibacillus sp. CC-CFT747]